jgi:hypothetical protein
LTPFDADQRDVFDEGLALVSRVGYGAEEAALSLLATSGHLGYGPYATSALTEEGTKIVLPGYLLQNSFPGKPPITLTVPLASQLVHELSHYTGHAGADDRFGSIVDPTAYQVEARFLKDLIAYFETGAGREDPKAASYIREARSRLGDVKGITKGVVQ